ncbi:MAG: metallophosphoesterase [Synergistaceae bacterium]|nr:metallophosphoesterase [Synergistaceae bacterium]
MIWVVGDIHGMYDPLQRLLKGIRMEEFYGEPVEKIIFIGDYMDHGPSSKEVFDCLLNLDYDAVFLAGNHEDMAIRFMNQDPHYLFKYGNQWFGNGGVDTYESIFAHRQYAPMLSKIQKCRREPFGERCKTYAGLELPEKYERFIRGVKYTHREEIGGVGFSFFHGLPRWDMTLEEQRVETHDEFNALLDKEGRFYPLYTPASAQIDGKASLWNDYVSIDGSFIWGRGYNYRSGYGGDVVVHGHTQTCYYEKYFLQGYYRKENLVEDYAHQFEEYSPEACLPFLFSLGKGAGYAYRYTREEIERPSIRSKDVVPFRCGEDGAIEAVNIDTGAVFGGALTAIGLSDELLTNGEIFVLTVLTSGGQRGVKQPIQRHIRADFQKNRRQSRRCGEV